MLCMELELQKYCVCKFSSEIKYTSHNCNITWVNTDPITPITFFNIYLQALTILLGVNSLLAVMYGFFYESITNG